MERLEELENDLAIFGGSCAGEALREALPESEQSS